MASNPTGGGDTLSLSDEGVHLEVFPLLEDPTSYQPNMIDLSDIVQRRHWEGTLCFKDKLVEKAVASDGGSDEAKERGHAFDQAYSAFLARLREEPTIYAKLGLANLLQEREEMLHQFHFMDVYKSIKEMECVEALRDLPGRLIDLDACDEEERLLRLIEEALVANVFDRGIALTSIDPIDYMSAKTTYEATLKVASRPWQIDHFDAFKEKILGSKDELTPPYKRALVFVDNSGYDIIFGMLPLVRELLRLGTEVVLVANSLPATNDVTAMELKTIISQVAKHCDILRMAAKAGGLLIDENLRDSSQTVPRLMVVESGCRGPCIDLRQVSSELAAAAKDADLVVLEGMGRAVFTNLNAKFKCDSLKLAIMKDHLYAVKLIGGKIYDCVCIFEPASLMDARGSENPSTAAVTSEAAEVTSTAAESTSTSWESRSTSWESTSTEADESISRAFYICLFAAIFFFCT